mmetsp:Transcript_15727/g.44779  ORF Transcript_15727/g.44779 Transcript_15727/m.44779 type:complete len:233 (-) Transcript_15727:293-991(-)
MTRGPPGTSGTRGGSRLSRPSRPSQGRSRAASSSPRAFPKRTSSCSSVKRNGCAAASRAAGAQALPAPVAKIVSCRITNSCSPVWRSASAFARNSATWTASRLTHLTQRPQQRRPRGEPRPWEASASRTLRCPSWPGRRREVPRPPAMRLEGTTLAAPGRRRLPRFRGGDGRGVSPPRDSQVGAAPGRGSPPRERAVPRLRTQSCPRATPCRHAAGLLRPAARSPCARAPPP